MTDGGVHISRAERRRRTEGRILECAREVFSEYGYERATIRGIAVAAGVNPGLVMHYYGSKERLFSLATEVRPDEEGDGSPEEVAERILVNLHAKLARRPTAELAMLRSMLTHPEAAEGVRNMVGVQQRQIEESLPAGDARLRAGLTSATILGVIVGRYLLELDGLQESSPEEVSEHLRPWFRSLMQNRSDEAREP